MKYTFRWISDSNGLDLVWNEYLNILNQSINDKAILGFNSNALSFDIFKKFVEILNQFCIVIGEHSKRNLWNKAIFYIN